MNVICFKLFWYKAFVHWKLILLNFLRDSILGHAHTNPHIFKNCIIISRHIRDSGFRNQRKWCLWNSESWVLESGIQLKDSGILLTIGIQNPSSTDKYWNPVPGIRNPHRGIQNPRLSWIPYKWGELFFYSVWCGRGLKRCFKQIRYRCPGSLVSCGRNWGRFV